MEDAELDLGHPCVLRGPANTPVLGGQRPQQEPADPWWSSNNCQLRQLQLILNQLQPLTQWQHSRVHAFICM